MNPCSRPEWTLIHVPVHVQKRHMAPVYFYLLVYIIYILGS